MVLFGSGRVGPSLKIEIWDPCPPPHREFLLDRCGYVVLVRVVETRPQNRNLGSLPPHREFLLDRRGYVVLIRVVETSLQNRNMGSVPPPWGVFAGPTWLCGIDTSGGEQIRKSKSGIFAPTPSSGVLVGTTRLCGIDSSGGDQTPKSKFGILAPPPIVMHPTLQMIGNCR